MSTQPRRTTRVPSSTSISSIPAGNSKILRQSTNNIPSSQSQQTSLRSNDNPSTRTDLPLPPNKLSRPPSAASALSSLSRTSSRMDMNGGNAAKGRTRAESRAIVMPEREKENGDVNIEVVVRCRYVLPYVSFQMVILTLELFCHYPCYLGEGHRKK